MFSVINSLFFYKIPWENANPIVSKSDLQIRTEL